MNTEKKLSGAGDFHHVNQRAIHAIDTIDLMLFALDHEDVNDKIPDGSLLAVLLMVRGELRDIREVSWEAHCTLEKQGLRSVPLRAMAGE